MDEGEILFILKEMVEALIIAPLPKSIREYIYDHKVCKFLLYAISFFVALIIISLVVLLFYIVVKWIINSSGV